MFRVCGSVSRVVLLHCSSNADVCGRLSLVAPARFNRVRLVSVFAQSVECNCGRHFWRLARKSGEVLSILSMPKWQSCLKEVKKSKSRKGRTVFLGENMAITKVDVIKKGYCQNL